MEMCLRKPIKLRRAFASAVHSGGLSKQLLPVSIPLLYLRSQKLAAPIVKLDVYEL